jgi:hypothetical protein
MVPLCLRVQFCTHFVGAGKKRHQALDETRRQEGLQKMKEDRKIRQEILRATRGETSVSPKRRSPKRSGGAAAASPSADSFFLTEM